MPLKADTITKDDVKDAGVFQLTERDSAKIALPYGADAQWFPFGNSVMCKNYMWQ